LVFHSSNRQSSVRILDILVPPFEVISGAPQECALEIN